MVGKILVVDDEMAIREILKFIVEMADYDVDAAADGDIALGMCEAKKTMTL